MDDKEVRPRNAQETRMFFSTGKKQHDKEQQMKRKMMIAVVAALVLALASFSYAKYVSGFKVVEVSGQQVTIQRGEEKPVMVTVKNGGYQVGNKVEYDADKVRVRKVPEGC